MLNLHVEYSGKNLDFHTASAMALAQARTNHMKQPTIVSWRQHGSHSFSPGFEGADEASWWAKYGQGNGGQVDIRVGEDFEFIVMESGGFETVRSLPLRNLRDADGAEYVCLAPMLDGTNKPRIDACSPLDDWAADQF
jgi:hypothetical protein